jgi:hypothetical protein
MFYNCLNFLNFIWIFQSKLNKKFQIVIYVVKIYFNKTILDYQMTNFCVKSLFKKDDTNLLYNFSTHC